MTWTAELSRAIWAGRNDGLTGTGHGNTVFVNPNCFMAPASSETDAELLITSNITCSAIAVNISANNVDNPSYATVRKNGADTAVSAKIPANTTGNFMHEADVSISSGDALTVELSAGAGATGDAITFEKWSVQYEIHG